MATKLQFYQSVADGALSELTAGRGNWTRYLDTAARLYKYPFQDRLMIYAQRPDATACAELELWNEKFNRRVRRGSKGIALIDDSGNYPRLKYVFDVSDTEASLYRAKPVQLWEMRQEHKKPVLAEIARNYEDIDADGSLADAFRSIANRLAGEYYGDNRREIAFSAENSVLAPVYYNDFSGALIEQADDSALMKTFTDVLSESIAYTVMARCGLDTAEYFDGEAFRDIIDFNTPDMAQAIGVATAELSEQILRDVELTIRKYERVKDAQIERSNDRYDRNPYLHGTGRLSSPEHPAQRAAEGGNAAPRQIRGNEESVPQRTQEDNVQPSAAVGETVPAPAGSGGSGEPEVPADNDGALGADESAGQRKRADEVDGGDEHAESAGGGSDSERSDLRIDPPPRFDPAPITETLSTSAVTLAEVDSVLRDGGNGRGSCLRIAARFAKAKTPEELSSFLRREYLQGASGRRERESGKGYDFGDRRISAWFDKDGISLAGGTTAKNNIHRVTISWERAAARVSELMLAGEYVDRATFDKALDNERLELAGRLWFFYRDDMHFIPEEWSAEHGGYPEDEALIKSLLDDPDGRQAILDRVEADVNQFNYDEHEHVWSNPNLLLENMRASMLPAAISPNDGYGYKRDFTGFITQDEIDAYLAHRDDEMKCRILSAYLTGDGDKDFERFLKESYGLGGGGTHALGGADNSYGDYSPSNGITLSRGNMSEPFTKVTLTWNRAAKRVKSLIESGRFMNRAELDGIASYERLMLARTINAFYRDLPQEYERPFDGLDFHYPHENEWNAINDFINDDERVDSVLAQMQYLLENTPEDDSYYDTRKKGFERLSAFQGGTYTLFPGLENLPDPEAVITTRFNGTRREPVRETVIDLNDSPSFPFGAEPARIEQLSLFGGMNDSPLPILPGVDEQRAKIDDALRAEAERIETSADAPFLAISEADRARIADRFTTAPRSREAANLVKEVYGDTLDMPVPQAVKHIAELVAEGRFSIPEPKPEPAQAEEKTGEPYKAGDTLWLDGRKFVIDKIGNHYSQPDDLARKFDTFGYSVSLTDITGGYPLSRSMYSAEIDRKLELDGRNAQFAPLGRISEQSAPEVAAEAEAVTEPVPTAQDVPAPDFETVAQTVYDRVMADDSFAHHLQFAKSRGALRSPLNTALDRIIGELQADESAVYGDYFNDDITDDLFEHVYKTAWAQRPVPEAEQEIEPQFTEIADPAALAEADGISPETPIMVIDGAARQNYNLFALSFPRIADGTHQTERYKGENKQTLTVWHDTSSAGLIHAEIAYYTPDGRQMFDPTVSAKADFERRMLTADSYANTRTGEDIGLLTLRAGTDEEKTLLSLKLAEFISETRKQIWTLEQTEVFRDADGNELPAEPKTNLTEFLTGIANREADAHFRVQQSMFAPAAEPEPESHPRVAVESILSPGAAVAQAYSRFEAVRNGTMKLDTLVLKTDGERYRATGLDALVLNDLYNPAGYKNTASGVFYTAGNEKMPGFSVSDLLPLREITQKAGYTIELDGAELELIPEPPANNFRITDDRLGEGGAKLKFRSNISALQTLKTLERELRNATSGEQETLSRYIGWGGLPQAFDPDNKEWAKEYAELSELLTPDEFASARASTLNAHYTSPTVVKAMWETIGRMGFDKGNILEPSMGVGNFFGLIPASMSGSRLYGVELDSVTARIARKLYPNADIRQTGFEKTEFSDAFFDLAIGNVPFGNYKVADSRYKQGFSIHDYFFQKSLDKVRPGGIVAFITSKFTLDSRNPEVRKYIAQRAELLGAVRLPNNAFLKNAGTETTMDILFLQKRDRQLDIEPDWVHLGLTEDGLPVNRCFLDNPEMVCGTMGLDVHMNNKYGRNDYTACLPTEGADLAEQLKTAMSYINGEYSVTELDDLDGVDDHAIPADTNVRNFSYALITPAAEPNNADGKIYAAKIGEGQVYFRENSLMYPVDLPAATLDRIKGMIGLRTCVRELIDLQLDDYASDSAITSKQAELNELYAGFIAEFGLINSAANNRAFNADSAYYLLSSLEIINEDGELLRKADMFTKRTIRQKTVITHVDTASEALAVSLGERAFVDLDYMSELTGKTRETLLDELRGVVFLNVGNAESQEKTYVAADEYLSGNVREKLKLAEAAALDNPSLKINVDALKAIQPKDLEAEDISVRLGATWIDPKHIQEFMYGIMNTSYYNKRVYQVHYHRFTGEWQVTGKGKGQYSDISATMTYGTGRMNGYQILEDTLNLRDVRVYDRKEDADGKEHRVLNKKETMLAQQKQELIKQAFRDWIWKDPERRRELVTLYNERFNSVRPREYDGSHITFGGISQEIELRPHQLNAIAHILYGGNTLLAHEVGAGKTFEMVAAAMESKRLGQCHKSLFAVPNHLTEQWAAEFLRLYPSANILVATKKDFEMRNRKKFCAKIATGDYDAVIIGHSQLEKIPMSRERRERQMQEQIWEVEEGIRELKASNGEKFSIKQLEKTKRSLETRLTKLLDSKKRDDVVTFEQLGCDRLYVDEAHNFKNLFLYTKMRNVAGLSTTEAQKSSDLFMKCRYLDELTDNKGVIFATGTPISNSMTEMFTMQRYLQHDRLAAMGLLHFDSWASIFGETQTSIELAPEGTGYRARTRFSKFHNLPEAIYCEGSLKELTNNQ